MEGGARGSIGERIFRWLLHAYPPRFRRAFETELLAFFRQDRKRAQRHGTVALTRFWVKTLVDLARSALRQRTRSHFARLSFAEKVDEIRHSLSIFVVR